MAPYKPLQIFLFSLIPLALVFTGVIIGSIHGSDSDAEDFSAPPPPAPTGPARTPTPRAMTDVTLQPLEAANARTAQTLAFLFS